MIERLIIIEMDVLVMIERLIIIETDLRRGRRSAAGCNTQAVNLLGVKAGRETELKNWVISCLSPHPTPERSRSR
jgi:hypothetical protein